MTPPGPVANTPFTRQTHFVSTFDLICIGAGPTGLATAIEAKRAGMRPLVIDKGCLCNSLYHYPVNMVFFTTPELLEIGDLPLTSAAEKPTRTEALKYYRKCAEHYSLELRLGERVEKVDGSDGCFQVHTRNTQGAASTYTSQKIVVATGYYDLPNSLGVPGEDLPHVSHYYTEPHPYWQQDVVVVGGKNSAAEAALDLYRAGARVFGSPWRGARLDDQVLGATGYRESHQGRTGPRPSQHHREAHWGRPRLGLQLLRGTSVTRGSSFCVDGVPSRLRFLALARHFLGSGNE